MKYFKTFENSEEEQDLIQIALRQKIRTGHRNGDWIRMRSGVQDEKIDFEWKNYSHLIWALDLFYSYTRAGLIDGEDHMRITILKEFIKRGLEKLDWADQTGFTIINFVKYIEKLEAGKEYLIILNRDFKINQYF